MRKRKCVVYSSARIIQTIMEERNLSCAEATKLWYNSKTKAATLDGNLWAMGVARMYEELEMELSNDPLWMKLPFD